MLKIAFVLVTVWAAQVCHGQKCQKTNNDGPVKDTACIFPFIVTGKKFEACTSDHDPDGKFWCSTKVDQDGAHQTGNWGYCEPGCVEYTNEIIRCSKTKSEATKKERPCIFPFKYEGKTYRECINLNQEDPSKYWCPTKLDLDGKFIPGDWGYCDRDCKSDPGDDLIDSDVVEFVNLDTPPSNPRIEILD